MSRSTLNTTINTLLADHSDITATELRQVHMEQADYGDQQDALKVDKVTGKSLLLDTEITRLGTLSVETGASIVSKLGFTPVPYARQITINGTTLDLSQDRSWTIATNVGSVAWGSLTGSLTGQTDLQSALNAKQATGDYATNTDLSTAIGTEVTNRNNAISAAIPASSLQPETQTYLANIKTAGGKIGGRLLNVVDQFIARGKSFGWYSKGKEAWGPFGDFAASKVKIISTTAWTFNNLSASDYSEENAYVISGNSDKYISTGFIPDNQGLSSRNISIAYASTEEVTPSNFGRIVGTATNEPLCISNSENFFYVGSKFLQHSFGGEATCVVGSWGATKVRCYLNGTFQAEINSETVSLPDEINIFRSMRGNGMQYANGSMGFYWIGTELTQAEQADLNLAIMDLMRETRLVYKKPVSISFGDSITAGTGASGKDAVTKRWSKLFTTKISAREQNNAQGSSSLVSNDSGSGAISAMNRYLPLLHMPSICLPIVYGTNDIGSDVTTNGDTTIINNYYNNLSGVLLPQLKEKNHRLLVGSVPYRSDITATKNLAYVVKGANAAKDNNVPFVDFYNAFLDTGSPASYLQDSVHPNDAGHTLMAEYMYAGYQGKSLRKPTIDFGSIPSNSIADEVVTVYNVTPGMSVVVTPISTMPAGLVILPALITADDTVTVRVWNITGAAIDPSPLKFNVTVFTNK